MIIDQDDKFFPHLLFESCSKSRGMRGQELARSRCQRWESPGLQSHCWLSISVPCIVSQFSPVVNPDRGPVPSCSCCRSACCVPPGHQSRLWNIMISIVIMIFPKHRTPQPPLLETPHSKKKWVTLWKFLLVFWVH